MLIEHSYWHFSDETFTVQKTIESLLRGIPNVINYQDDIVVTGSNFDEHIKTLRIVLSKLQRVNLKLNLDKCVFFQEQISYLGFIIDRNGQHKTNERIDTILKAPFPTDVSQIRSFVGMVNYYSKFINKFAEKMKPFYELLQKDVKFHWSDECKAAYALIKKEVTSDQVLVHFNPKLPIILETDASNKAVAGILSHRFQNGEVKPIAFIFRTLSQSEINYSVIEKEALAIIFSVTKLKQYSIGTHFELNTDHKPLLAIYGEHKGLPLMASARLQRWAFTLSGFHYTVKYVKGETNRADGLTRMPLPSALLKLLTYIFLILTMCSI